MTESRRQEFYHGSNHDFEVGDVIHPDYDPYGDGESHATNSRYWASSYGVRLYQVDPIGKPSMVNEHEGVEHWVSRQGWKVRRSLI